MSICDPLGRVQMYAAYEDGRLLVRPSFTDSTWYVESSQNGGFRLFKTDEASPVYIGDFISFNKAREAAEKLK